MVEVYAFLAAFAAQILAMSVLCPAWFIKYARAQATKFPPERFAQLYPGVDAVRAQERFLPPYRALNMAIAFLGLLLMGWLYNYMQRPDWDDGPVEALVCVYFAIQMLPLAVIGLLGLKAKHDVLKRSAPEGKRKAILQRRGLLDFISPFVVFLAILVYFLFVAFVIYLWQHPFPGFAGLFTLAGITLVYVLNGSVAYYMLYGKKINPVETHAGHLRTIGLAVKSCVYSCIVCVVFVSLNFTLVLLDLQRWEPLALSVFFVITTLLCLMGFTAPPRNPEADGFDADSQLTPRTRDVSA